MDDLPEADSKLVGVPVEARANGRKRGAIAAKPVV
jgi:hypothetical protein